MLLHLNYGGIMTKKISKATAKQRLRKLLNEIPDIEEKIKYWNRIILESKIILEPVAADYIYMGKEIKRNYEEFLNYEYEIYELDKMIAKMKNILELSNIEIVKIENYIKQYQDDKRYAIESKKYMEEEGLGWLLVDGYITERTLYKSRNPHYIKELLTQCSDFFILNNICVTGIIQKKELIRLYFKQEPEIKLYCSYPTFFRKFGYEILNGEILRIQQIYEIIKIGKFNNIETWEYLINRVNKSFLSKTEFILEEIFYDKQEIYFKKLKTILVPKPLPNKKKKSKKHPREKVEIKKMFYIKVLMKDFNEICKKIFFISEEEGRKELLNLLNANASKANTCFDRRDYDRVTKRDLT